MEDEYKVVCALSNSAAFDDSASEVIRHACAIQIRLLLLLLLLLFMTLSNPELQFKGHSIV